jgi:predicted MPP superfamily phosphohydrolase
MRLGSISAGEPVSDTQRHTPQAPASITRRSFITGGAIAGIGLAAYSATYARHEFEITERTFPIRNLPDVFEGFRMVQISDLHLEEYTETWFLEEIVRQVNGLKPDLVLITGDFISRGPRDFAYAWHQAGICAEILSGLKAPQRFGILGNHDAAVGESHVIAPLEAHGIPILVDSYVPIERGRDLFWLCGFNDAGVNTPDPNLAIPPRPNAPCIALCHEPDYVDRFVEHPRFPLVDLMLSGHTHGGQLRLPLVGPLILPPMGVKYVQGLFQFGHMKLYVNRGIGTVGLPFRLNCPAEITHITLTRA